MIDRAQYRFFFFFEVYMMIDDGKGIKNIRVAPFSTKSVFIFVF